MKPGVRRPGVVRSALLALLIALTLIGSGCTLSINRQEQVVPLEIVEGPQGSVLALVPVFIRDQGPFAFALDTGASQSLVDQSIVDQLGLPVIGRTGEVVGITGVTEATIIEVDQWRAGDVALPETTAITLELPEPQNGVGIRGLLGSDILSEFGAITVDYERQELILRALR